MERSEEVDRFIAEDLQVSALDKNVVIPLHETLARPVMPVANDEIPKQEDVERWPHLSRICPAYRRRLPSGTVDRRQYVSEALQLREVIPAADGDPYATSGP